MTASRGLDRAENRLVIFRSVPDVASVNRFVATLQSELQKARESVLLHSGPSSGMLSELAPLTELEAVAELQKAGLIRSPKELLLATVLPEPGAITIESKIVWDKESQRIVLPLREQLDANGVPCGKSR